MGSPIDENPCLICGIKPIESGVHSLELFFRYRYEVDSKVCVYPGGGYTLSVWNQEGSVEIPLNFCPECGRDLRRKDGKRGEWIDTGGGGYIIRRR